MTIRFGLLGAGRIGKVHAKAVTGDANARLVAVADAFPAAAQAIAEQYGCEVRSIDAICAAALARPAGGAVFCRPAPRASRCQRGRHTGSRRARGEDPDRHRAGPA